MTRNTDTNGAKVRTEEERNTASLVNDTERFLKIIAAAGCFLVRSIRKFWQLIVAYLFWYNLTGRWW